MSVKPALAASEPIGGMQWDCPGNKAHFRRERSVVSSFPNHCLKGSSMPNHCAGAMDAFYEEDERIVGHAAESYHHIDIRETRISWFVITIR
jgi:hypothetical protein